MNHSWSAVEAALGRTVVRADPVTGGDICNAYKVRLADGCDVFVKTHSAPEPGMFPAEAEGLAWLSEGGEALRVPAVLSVSNQMIVLEYIGGVSRAPDYEQRLGRGLAALHRTGAGQFGWHSDNWIGTLSQPNASAPLWSEFYGVQRLATQLAHGARSGRVSSQLARAVESVIQRLPELVGDDEPPARLHGDLWGGNVIVDEVGAPCIIDPAVYGGHREVDLAMMQLFGGFGGGVFEAYGEAYPLAPEWRERVLLYQLYPLLVHVNLFGDGYAAQALHAAETYL